uniref:Uncharacterized protein n=1 Tax=Peronospora matthiolae TaxID=2874970 RepID=A0AAV1TJ60_9STRA
MAVRNATGASLSLVLKQSRNARESRIAVVLASQYDLKRSEKVVHVLEIALWAQTYEENDNHAASQVKTSVAVGVTANATTDTRISKDKNDDGEMRWGFSGPVYISYTNDDCIIDFGASAHLVKNSSMLYDWNVFDDLHGVNLPDKSQLHVTRKVKAKIKVNVDDDVS